MSKRVYLPFNYPGTTDPRESKILPDGSTHPTGLTGIRSRGKIQYITGFFGSPATATGLVYKGKRTGQGMWYLLNVPNATGTNLYGPNLLSEEQIRVVGSYFTTETGNSNLGCMYEGKLNGSGVWTTLLPTSSETVLNTIAHSSACNIVVGNFDTVLIQGKAFIYDIQTQEYFNVIPVPNIKSITAYGVWDNGHDQYTIAGSYTSLDAETGLTSAYLVDWNNRTRRFSNFTTYSYNNESSIITHFDGISSPNPNHYVLTGDWVGVTGNEQRGFVAYIHRDRHCRFSHEVKWEPLNYPGHTATSGNSVDYIRSTVVGITRLADNTTSGYISYLV